MKGWKKLLLGATATLAACHVPAGQSPAPELSSSSYLPQIDDNVSLKKRAREIKTKNGRFFFSKEQIDTLHRTNTLEDALDFAKNSSHSVLDIVRYSRLGVTRKEVDEFTDTEKPNAVLIFPSEDENMADTSAFYNPYNRAIINSLRKDYDLLVKIAYLESDICDATNKAKNAEVLMLAGHGSKSTLLLGKQDKFEEETGAPREESVLSMNDLDDLRKCFSTLSPSAVIFLSSCSTAEEDKHNYNLANIVRKASNYRKVIAAKKSFNVLGITLDSTYPLSLRIIAIYRNGTREDVTYIGKTFDEIYAGLRLPKNSMLETKALKFLK